MCLILFAHECHPEYRLILAANRDEFYDRPSASLSFWRDSPGVLAGRDLKSGGTWLGITRNGRIAAITNFRDPASMMPDAPSRGDLVSRFLQGNDSPETYLQNVRTTGGRYNGFNLLAGQGRDLYYYSNRGGDVEKISPGIYGLSNDLLDVPWPKVAKGKRALQCLLDHRKMLDPRDVFALLRDDAYAPDESLPETGVGVVWEKILSPVFISSRIYGTRCSSVLLVERTGKISFLEKTYEREGGMINEKKCVAFELKLYVTN
jgi:uncharacterized protein with NRDE domain